MNTSWIAYARLLLLMPPAVPALLALPALPAPPAPPALQQRPTHGLDIHYVPTPAKVVDAMLTVANVTANDVVYDLGSGDGRIVIAAAQRYGARGVGVELDPELIKVARKAASKAGVTSKVTFQQTDLFKADLSAATVVTLYLSPTTNLRLRGKLQRELRPGTRVVSHRFDMGDWKPNQDVRVGETHVYLWTIQAR